MTDRLSIVVAMSRNRVIGRGGRLPWHIPEDLRRFKALTMGHALIMGRRTHESIGRPLPGRRNIVLSRSAVALPGCEVAGSLPEALRLARTTDPEPFVIGGAEVFREAMPLATRLHLTRIDRDVDGDVSFPGLDPSQWREVSRESAATERDVVFVVLERIVAARA